MKLLTSAVLSLSLLFGVANAAVIEIQFDTLAFSDGHQVNGWFTYNTNQQKVESLDVSLFGDQHNIDFSLEDLSSPDALSVDFDNDIFGDDMNEGFQLFSSGIYLLTGFYGYGAADTCYADEDDNFYCTSSLFVMTSAEPIFATVDEPQPAALLLFGSTLLILRIFRK